MNSHQTTQNDNNTASVDIASTLTGIWARKHWVIMFTLIAFALSVMFVVTATPEYQATARVKVQILETDFSRTDPRRSAVTPIDQQEVKSQVEVLMSRDLAKKVIKKLDLTSLAEFDATKRGTGPVSSFLIGLGFKADPARQTPEQRALTAYYKKLTVYHIPESKVIVINMRSKSPKIAAAVANTLAEVFVQETRSVQMQTTSRAGDWLADQITSLRKKVIESEVAVEKFRANAGLLKGRDQNATLSSQELSELNTQIILAEAQRSEIQARAKAIRNMLARTGSVASSSEVLNSPLIQRLRERQITLRGNLATLSTTYLPNHPRVASVRREIAGLNRQIRAEALKIVSGLEQQAKISTARVASLRASLNGLKTRASGTNLDQVKLRALEREAKANRTLLETFLTKYSDAKSRESAQAQPGLARLISRADVPSEPSFPKPVATVALATIGGFVLSLGFAFMASVMAAVAGSTAANQQPVHREQEVPASTHGVPQYGHPAASAEYSWNGQAAAPQQMAPAQHQVLTPTPAAPVTPSAMQSSPIPPVSPVPVTTPSLSQLPASTSLEAAKANALAVVQKNGSPFAAGIVPVTSWANSARQTLGVKRLAVVGTPGADLDTAATCLALARSLAAQNIRTIIVDAAMQGSQFAAMTGTANLPGLADLLTGYASFLDVIIKDDYSNARIMRVGQPLAAAWPLLGSDRMATVLAALDSDENHDVVIIHGGILSANTGIENGAVAKCQSSLLLVSPDQVAMTGNVMQNLAAAGMRSSQYIRIADGGGARQVPDNVTPLNPAFVANAAMQQANPQAANIAQAGAPVYNTPLFPKIAV